MEINYTPVNHEQLLESLKPVEMEQEKKLQKKMIEFTMQYLESKGAFKDLGGVGGADIEVVRLCLQQIAYCAESDARIEDSNERLRQLEIKKPYEV